jgi:hypothetical protein
MRHESSNYRWPRDAGHVRVDGITFNQILLLTISLAAILGTAILIASNSPKP